LLNQIPLPQCNENILHLDVAPQPGNLTTDLVSYFFIILKILHNYLSGTGKPLMSNVNDHRVLQLH